MMKTTVNVEHHPQDVKEFVTVAEDVVTVALSASQNTLGNPKLQDVLNLGEKTRQQLVSYDKQASPLLLVKTKRYIMSLLVSTVQYLRETYVYLSKLEDVYQELLDTVIRKNIDYGSSFDKGVADFGVPGFLIRLYDKENRIKSLMTQNSEALVQESMYDTLLDLAGYSLLTLILSERHPEYIQK